MSGWRVSTPTRCRSCASIACMSISCRTTGVSRAASSRINCRSPLADQERASSDSRRSCACRRRSSTVSAIFFGTARSGCGRWCCAKIANTLGLHESTVSRVTNAEIHVHAARYFRLKYSSEVTSPPRRGAPARPPPSGRCSSSLVAAEDARNLFRTQDLRDPSQQGIVVARRTIAKYRESAEIPSVSMRSLFDA